MRSSSLCVLFGFGASLQTSAPAILQEIVYSRLAWIPTTSTIDTQFASWSSYTQEIQNSTRVCVCVCLARSYRASTAITLHFQHVLLPPDGAASSLRYAYLLHLTARFHGLGNGKSSVRVPVHFTTAASICVRWNYWYSVGSRYAIGRQSQRFGSSFLSS